MTAEKDILLETERFRVVKIDRLLPDGTLRTRQVIRHPGSVVILPMVDAEHVCLIRNHRVSVGSELLELPAGTLEPGESPAACAHRELTEETGFVANKMTPMINFFAAPGILDERMHLFRATELVPGDHHREPGEEIENEIVTLQEAIQRIHSNEIQDAKTIAGLLYFWTFGCKDCSDPVGK